MGGYAFTATLFSPYVSKIYAAYYTSASFFYTHILLALWRIEK
jgi:hypothetical protein